MKMLLPPGPLGKETPLQFALDKPSVPWSWKNRTQVPQVTVVIKKELRTERLLADVSSLSLKSRPTGSSIVRSEGVA